MQHDDRIYVGHMLDTARRITSRTSGLGRGAFSGDEDLQLALTHLVQMIGEAARKVSPTFRETHPSIPWAAIIGMRHRVVHDYLDVDLDLVWEVCSIEIPKLIPLLESIAD
jgi:uncharacterized protein with HEPN domain